MVSLHPHPQDKVHLGFFETFGFFYKVGPLLQGLLLPAGRKATIQSLGLFLAPPKAHFIPYNDQFLFPVCPSVFFLPLHLPAGKCLVAKQL